MTKSDLDEVLTIAFMRGAESGAQAAERGPVEPVCPEGVTVERFGDGSCTVRLHSTVCFRIESWKRGAEVHTDVVTKLNGQHWPAWLARYAADLCEHMAAIHAASDKQRKLDAVKAANDAWDAARKAHSETSKRVNDAHEALSIARREAGL